VPAPLEPRLLGSLPGLEWKARYVMEGFLPGVHGSPFHGAGVEFREYRQYEPGDDPRRLDWRLYARNDRLYVRRYEHETNARCYILCDSSGSMGYRGQKAWATKLEAAKVVSLALGWMLLGQADAVGLLAVQSADGGGRGGEALRYLRPAQRPLQGALLQRDLARLSAGGGPLLSVLLERAVRIARRRSLILLVSDLLEPSEAVELGLRRLRFDGHECVCLQVLDGEEEDFPFTEPAVFEDMETGHRRRVSGSAVRETYRSRFEDFMGRWRALLRRLDVPHVVVRTDEDPAVPLRRLFSARARREGRR
jgi:uncharacterized protein (DUF58 family)